MLLSVTDRLLLLGLLPQQGNITMLRVIREARQSLELSADEIVAWEVSQVGDAVRWNQQKAADAEIPLSAAALGIARTAIRQFDTEGKLTTAHIPLWEKLVDGSAD